MIRCNNPGRADLPGGRVGDRHRLPGVVDEQLLAGDVDLAHRALEGARPVAVLDAKTGVLVRQRVAAGVLLPQQHPRHAGTLAVSRPRGLGRQFDVQRLHHRQRRLESRIAARTE